MEKNIIRLDNSERTPFRILDHTPKIIICSVCLHSDEKKKFVHGNNCTHVYHKEVILINSCINLVFNHFFIDLQCTPIQNNCPICNSKVDFQYHVFVDTETLEEHYAKNHLDKSTQTEQKYDNEQKNVTTQKKLKEAKFKSERKLKKDVIAIKKKKSNLYKKWLIESISD